MLQRVPSPSRPPHRRCSTKTPNTRLTRCDFAPSSSANSSPQCCVQQCWRRAIRFQEASPAAIQSPIVQGLSLTESTCVFLTP